MTTASASPSLPPRLIRASLLASIVAGPLWLCLLSLLNAVADGMPGIAHLIGIEPTAGLQPAPLHWLFLPLVAIPLTLPVCLLIVFPITALFAVIVFALFPDHRWPTWRRTWALFGTAIGALTAPWIMTMWFGPSADGVDTWQFVGLGALDGAGCAFLARRYAARHGAFDPKPDMQE